MRQKNKRKQEKKLSALGRKTLCLKPSNKFQLRKCPSMGHWLRRYE